MAFFKGPQIFVAHSDYILDVMMTMLLGLASHGCGGNFQKKGHCLPSAENCQFAGGIGVDLQRKIGSLLLQFKGAGPCGCSCAPVFLNLIRHANPFSKYAEVRGSPDLLAVAHRLRTSVLDLVVVCMYHGYRGFKVAVREYYRTKITIGFTSINFNPLPNLLDWFESECVVLDIH